MKKKKRRKIRIRVCPICQSRNIRLSSSLDGWLTPEIYICEDCGYKGPIYLELQVDEEDVKGD